MKTAPYTFTAAELLEVARLRVRPPVWWMVAFFGALVAVAAATALALVIGFPSLDMPADLLITVAVLWVCLFAIRPHYQKTIYAWTTRNAASLNAPGVLSIDESGFRWESDLTRSWVAWKSVLAVKRGKNGAYLFTQPGAAFAVPDRVFATEAERTAFHNAALGFWQAAKTNAP